MADHLKWLYDKKLAVRLRKRSNLPENMSKFRDAKYDPAFNANLMSDDEDEIGEDGRWTGKYLSHAPAYRSQEVSYLRFSFMISETHLSTDERTPCSRRRCHRS
jgi:hypothetical protein